MEGRWRRTTLTSGQLQDNSGAAPDEEDEEDEEDEVSPPQPSPPLMFMGDEEQWRSAVNSCSDSWLSTAPRGDTTWRVPEGAERGTYTASTARREWRGSEDEDKVIKTGERGSRPSSVACCGHSATWTAFMR